ncbi:hypothetical protein H8E06_00190 [bacterium]|nr:hypothetical protein [bacterium]
MNITYALLLLIFGGLSLWLLTESKIKWYIKTLCISTFCVFTIIFWSSIHTFLGWPARDADMPEKVKVHWVVIKEPDKLKETPGGIFFLVEGPNPHKDNFLYRLFGYQAKGEPRQYKLPYSRQLHEKLAANVVPKLKSGQPVFGEFTKPTGKRGKKSAGEKKAGKDGDGSESQEQDWEFHELRPSDFLSKPTD